MRGRHKLTVFTTKSACLPLFLLMKISSFTHLLATCLLVNLSTRQLTIKVFCDQMFVYVAKNEEFCLSNKFALTFGTKETEHTNDKTSYPRPFKTQPLSRMVCSLPLIFHLCLSPRPDALEPSLPTVCGPI